MKIDKNLILSFAQDINAIVKPDTNWDDVPQPVQNELCRLVAYLYYNYNDIDKMELLELDHIVVDYLDSRGC